VKKKEYETHVVFWFCLNEHIYYNEFVVE